MDFQRLRSCVAAQSYRLTIHAWDKSRQLHISVDDVAQVFSNGEIIETTIDESGIENHLVLGERFNGDQIHVACKLVGDILQINTLYFPDAEFWKADGRTRKRR